MNRHPDFPIISDLRRIRMAKRLTQSDLAAFMEMHPITIARWESRKYTPSLPALYRWCEALGLKLKIGEQT